jgi:hypothetical protein
VSKKQDTTPTHTPAPNHELVELLDRVIDKGVVVSGDVRLSVAGIELIYINLRALIASSDRIIEETAATGYQTPEDQKPKDQKTKNTSANTSRTKQ